MSRDARQRSAKHGEPLLDDAAVRRLRRRILTWYRHHGRDLPWRHTADRYAILVSEVMLQQTQVPRVIPKYTAFLHRYPDLESLASAPLAGVLALWSGLGYNNRAVRLRACAQAVAAATPLGERAELPRDVRALETLPGLGPYTARAVLVFAHDTDLAAVDANVRRVLIRELGLPPDIGLASLQEVAERVLPRGQARDWHNALMDYGAAVLTARSTGIAPLTRQGPFLGSRRWYRSQLLKLLLEKGSQRAAGLPRSLGLSHQEVTAIVAALAHDGLLEQRGDTVRLL
jgi:A/G-specific adenine glycosylase